MAGTEIDRLVLLDVLQMDCGYSEALAAKIEIGFENRLVTL